MAVRFLDSSAVAKFYHSELGSAIVEQVVLDPTVSILISLLSVVEVQFHRAGVMDNFVVADRVLCKVAAFEGLSITDPGAGPA